MFDLNRLFQWRCLLPFLYRLSSLLFRRRRCGDRSFAIVSRELGLRTDLLRGIFFFLRLNYIFLRRNGLTYG